MMIGRSGGLLCRALLLPALPLSMIFLAGCQGFQGSGIQLDAGAPIRRAWRFGGGVIAVDTEQEYQLWDTGCAEAPVLRAGLPESVYRKGVPLGEHRWAYAQDFWDPVQREGYCELAVLDLRDGKELLRVKRRMEIDGIAPTASSDLLVWTERERAADVDTFRLRVVRADSWQVIADIVAPLVSTSYQVVGTLGFSPDERLLAFGSWSGKDSIGVLDLDAKHVLWQLGEGTGAWDIAWCPDSRSFFVSDGMCRIQRYDARTGEVLWSEAMETVHQWPWAYPVYAHPQALDISPDGRYLACAIYPTCEVIVWEVASGKRVKTLKAWKTPIYQALFFDWDSKGLWGAGALDTKLKYVPLNLP